VVMGFGETLVIVVLSSLTGSIRHLNRKGSSEVA